MLTKIKSIHLSKKILCFIWVIIIISSFESSPLYPESLEYKIKASYLEKFTRFIEWPSNTFEDHNNPFIITVIGKNPFKNILDIMYSKIKIMNRNAETRYISNIEEINETHLLFISTVNKQRFNQILSRVKNKPILIVSDVKGYAKKGVHINFYTTKSKTIRFEINETAVRESGLKMSYLLLRLGKIIK